MIFRYVRCAVFILLAACIPSCSPQKECEKTVRINFPVDPSTLDPRKGRDVTSSCVQMMLYEGLTRLTPRSTSDYGLAEAIDLSDDKCTYTFTIRDAFWSDGHPVTSYDFAEAWRSMLEPDFPCPNVNLLYVIKNAERVKKGELPISQIGIRTEGSKKLIVELETPTPYFLELVAFCVFHPIPSHVVQNNPSWPDKDTSEYVTCGPYMMEKWSHWDEMIVSKSPTYWDRENVNHEKVQISFVENQNTAFQMYERGDLDMMGTAFTGLPLDAISLLREKNILESFPVAATTFCTFNTERFPFHNKNIRKAFALAIDRNDLVENITQLDEEPGVALIPSVLRSGVKKGFFKDASKEEAQALLTQGLKELGIHKDELDISLVFAMNDVNHKLSQEIQQQWYRVLGVTAKLQSLERTVFLDAMQRREYTIGLAFLHAQYNDQMNILERFKLKSNPKNYAGWYNKEYESLLTQALHSNIDSERIELMEQAEALLLDDMPLTPIYHWSTTFIRKPYIENVYFSPLGAVHLPSVTIHKKK